MSDSLPAEPTLGSPTRPHTRGLSADLLFFGSATKRLDEDLKMHLRPGWRHSAARAARPGGTEAATALPLTPGGLSKHRCAIFLMEAEFGKGCRSACALSINKLIS